MASFKHTRERVIVALDTTSAGEVVDIAEEFSGKVWGFKIGLEAMNKFGAPQLVEMVRRCSPGCGIFFDGKFHDIPNTIAGATRAIAPLDVQMFNIHAAAGPEGIKAAVAAKAESAMKLLGVTVLTSHSDEESRSIFGMPSSAKVLEFASWLAEAGADGLVCSAEEVRLIKASPLTCRLLAVVPGIRLPEDEVGDQSRIMTPKKAIESGADLLVIGRPITQAVNRMEALARIEENLSQ